MPIEPAESHDVVIVGAGPSGLAAARRLAELGIEDVVVLDREQDAGGAPRHCDHLGYGMLEFGRPMTGPGFARRIVTAARKVEIRTGVTVTKLETGGVLELATATGRRRLSGRRVLLALGVRETPRPARLVSGTRPWGVLTTGSLQQIVHIAGLRPCSSAVIVGSELVSFSAILTLRHAGIHTVAMIEESDRITAPRPGDLIARHLFGVPVWTGTRLLSIEGGARVESVVIERAGRIETVDCDGVIFTGCFRPESALLETSHIARDPGSGGPAVDQYGRCSDPTFFACGNLVHPTESAGRCYREGLATADFLVRDLAGRLAPAKRVITVERAGALRYVLPQSIAPADGTERSWQFNLRAARRLHGRLSVQADGKELWSRRLHALPERRLTAPSQFLDGLRSDRLQFSLEER